MNTETYCKDLFKNLGNGEFLTSLSDDEFQLWYDEFVDSYFEMNLNHPDLVAVRNEIWKESMKLFPIIEQRLDKICQDRIAQLESDSLNIEVDGIKYRAIANCDVLWLGWECDPTAWVVEKDGINQLVSTDHGTHHFYPKEFLEDRIAHYKQVIIESEKLLALLD